MSAPLMGFVALIYLGVAVSEIMNKRIGMGVAFVAYAVANLGLAWEMR